MANQQSAFTLGNIFNAIPLLIIVVVLYNIMVFVTGPTPDAVTNQFGAVFTIPLISGQGWPVTMGDILLIIGLVLLYIEIFRATRTDTTSIINHTLSMMLFVFCLIEFLMLAPMATSVFFLITMMTLIDVVTGFTVTIAAARRDFGFNAPQ